MRKSVLLIVGIVYFLSLLFVVFFGLQLSVINPVVLVESVEFTRVRIANQDGLSFLDISTFRTQDENGSPLLETSLIIISARPDLISETEYGRAVIAYVTWEVNPDYATNREVRLFPVESEHIIVNRLSGRILFLLREGTTSPPSGHRIVVEADDGSPASDTLIFHFI
ncbi:MAG: hypothetical protein FWC11_06850 [Firmicutes bacterium]|nr:hypothetical protein [Bacillota bacterium]